MIGLGNFKTLAAAAVLVMAAGVASAAPLACSTLAPNVSNLVTLNIGCQALITPDNDSNTGVSGMFGVTDWTQIAKVDPLPGSSGGFLTIAGNLQEGTWSINASVLSSWNKIMLVFKGGDKALPDAVIGYLINTLSGDYDSPFFDAKNGGFKVKDISHVSLYVSDPATIPVPAAGFLLVGALGGLAALRRRRRAA